MFDRATWEFINSFSPWLSAVGTILAVFISLHLARRDRTIRLIVHGGIRKMVNVGQRITDGTDIIMIGVTNVGHRAVTITGIHWMTGTFRQYTFEQVPGSSVYSSTLPVKLGDGDEAFFRIPMGQFEQGAESIIKTIGGCRFPAVLSRSIRVGVYTSAGGIFTARVDKNLRDWFVKKAKEYNQKLLAS